MRTTVLVAASALALLLFVMALILLLLFLPAVAFVIGLTFVMPAVLVLYGVSPSSYPAPLPDSSGLSGRWWP